MTQYNRMEKNIAIFLSKFPKLKATIKKIYQKLNYIRYKKNYSFKSTYPITKIAYKDQESFFGYYDKSPINITNEYIIFHSSNINTMGRPDPNVPVDIVLYDIKKNEYEIIGRSFTYNWQQGSKLMWLDNSKIIYNDYDADRDCYIAKIYDIRSESTKIIDYPIYDCFEDKFAISLNFERLNIGRADYSYSNRNLEIDWDNNENDGLYYIDLVENGSKLILSINDIIQFNHKESMDGARHKFNHIMISPDGKKIMFMHRWFLKDGRRYDALYTSNIDGTDVKIIADDGMVSHCYWYDNDSIFAYLRDKNLGDKYYLIDINTSIKKVVGEGVIDKFGDGHPHVYQSKVVFDTYPDKSRMKALWLYDLQQEQLEKLGGFFEGFNFYGETRCDLHPRFSFDGKKVFFDSIHDGKRALYMMELSK